MNYFFNSVLHNVVEKSPEAKLSRNPGCYEVELFLSPSYQLFSPKFEVGIRHEKLKVGGVGSPRALQGCAVRIMGTQRKSKD